MKQSQHFLENAENCAQLAERATDEPTHKRYKRMEAAWRALAEEQDWLDGEVPPIRIAVTDKARKVSRAT
jgi:ATP/maltotriose-dependent transcriptional regulator MalT